MVWDFFRVTPKKRTVKIKRGGIIYHDPPLGKKIVFGVGNWLLAAGVAYFIYLYYPLGRAIVRYKTSNQATIVYPTPVVKDQTYEIEIPKILAKSTVVAGVSPFDASEYLKALEREVVAQAKDSAFPGGGKGKSTYIFAHSTQQGIGMARKNAVFYLLGELKNNDVVFIRYNGQLYTYRVYDQKIVAGREIGYLTYTDPEKEVLMLQTCWPIGTDWKRLIVFAQRADY